MFHACFGDRSDEEPKARESFQKVCGRRTALLDSEPLLSNKTLDVASGDSSNVVVEIVGATGLQDLRDNNIDTFCLVKVNSKEVHRTKTIQNDFSPIFTVKTKSLCLLRNLISTDQVSVELCSPNKLVPGLFSTIGVVTLNFNEIANGHGERREFTIRPTDRMMRLALRYRLATDSDLTFFKATRHGSSAVENSGGRSPDASYSRQFLSKDNASDIEFREVTKKRILEQQQKTIKVDDRNEIAYRVFPFPDPDKPTETEFMTKSQMDKFMEEPSRHWVEAGWGEFGEAHLEVLGCDDLPNKDIEIIDGLTDAFVGCVFEDTFIRTSVMHDCLNPRWPPWSQRAVKFMIAHPSSILYLGVFDYDDNLLNDHDPIGRVVIHLCDFEPDTMYTLKYPLFAGDTQEDKHCGTITIRLRICWKKDISEVSKAQSFVTPPRFIINCESQRAWNAIRYLTRGSVDMTDVTVDSVKLYVDELLSHWSEYCYLFDVAASIVLWRGGYRFSIFGKSYSAWFPVDSIFLFSAVTIGMVHPIYLPSVFFYTIAYGLLRNNYYLSTNPSPWLCTKSARQIVASNHGAKSSRVRIDPQTGEEESRVLARIEEYRMHRVTGFIYESLMIALQVYRVYSKNTPVDISTVSSSGGLASKLYKDYLSYVHMMLKYMCTYIRVLKNLVNWKSSSTYLLTVKCLAAATIWSFFPYKSESLWLIRIMVWLLIGPWVKVIDIVWIRKYYRTHEDLVRDGVPETTKEMKDDIASRPNILEPLLRSSFVESMANTGRVVVEDNVKLRDFRQELYGKYSERIPQVDTTRFASVPMSTSFAQPFASSAKSAEEGDYVGLPKESQKWTYISGQKLEGTMIPQERFKKDL